MIKEIEDFDGLEALRLEGNTVGVEAARVIAKALEKKSELKVRSGASRPSLVGDRPPLTHHPPCRCLCPVPPGPWGWSPRTAPLLQASWSTAPDRAPLPV